MARELVLGVDLGTSSLKAVLFDLEGNLVSQAQGEYPILRPRPGWAEQDPRTWVAAFDEAVSELGECAAAVGICSQVNTHVFVDAKGEPLRDAVLWQDQRCASVADELGIPASFLPARAEWLRREQPELWERTHRILSPKDFLNSRLCGAAHTDPLSSFDIVDEHGRYDAQLVSRFEGLEERLPPIDWIDTPIGATQEGAVVVTATMDAWGSAYGSGLNQHGDAMDVAGTSEIVGVLSRDRSPTPGIVSFAAVDGHFLHAGPTQTSGGALAWFAGLVRLSIPQVVALAATVEDGPLFLPYLSGERAPLWDPDVRASFIGVSNEHTLAHFCRAVLVGVAFSARHLLEEIERAAGTQPRALRASGGGSQSDLWCQIKADVLARRIERLRVRQSGCLGVAMMAAAGAGLIDDLREGSNQMPAVEHVFEPGTSYDEKYAIYRDLYDALKPTHAALRGAAAQAR